MSILITGATGLIGSHLCKRLVSEGYPVVGLVHHRGNIITSSLRKFKNFNMYALDIRQDGILYEIIKKYKIKTVFHTAAQLPYTLNKDLVGVNVYGTMNVLKASCRNGVEEFIYASSMGVYSDPPSYLPVDEAHPTQPSTLYGGTKLVSELLCNSYAESMRVLILRYAGVYGITSEKSRAVNNFIRCAIGNESIAVDGDGSQSSDFAYVSDIVEGTSLAWKSKAQGVYNIGGGCDTTLMELARLIVSITNSKSDIVQNGNEVERPFRFWLDVSKARQDFSYSPRSLEEGLEAYVREFGE